MTTRLISCFFGDSEWGRLARVLEFSARRHCIGWDVEVVRLKAPPPGNAISASRISNTFKLDWWTEQVDAAADGTRLLLIDADTMILGPLDEVWAEAFDFGYTVKDGRYPFNAGVVFLRVSDRVREFMRAWRDENRKMFKDPAYHEPWRQQFAGMNQSALGKILTDNVAVGLGVTIGRLPCVTWNCENATWAGFREGVTRIVHIKDGLRPAALGTGSGSVRFMPFVKMWRAIEREAARA